MQPPALFIGYRLVDKEAHLPCIYLKAVGTVFIGYRLVDKEAHLPCIYLKAVGTFFIGYRTRINPGRPRLHWAGNPKIIMLGLPARSSRPAPSSGCAIPLWPRKRFAIIATIMTIIAIIAIGAPFHTKQVLHLVQSLPPPVPPVGGSPTPRLWAFLLGFALYRASGAPLPAASCKQSAPSKKARSRCPPQNRSNIFYLLPLSKKIINTK